MELPEGELAMAAEQGEGDAAQRVPPERAGVRRDGRQRRLVRPGWPTDPVPVDRWPEALVERDGLVDEGAAAMGPVDGFGVKGVEPVNDGLAVDVDQLADGPAEPGGTARPRVRVFVEVAGCRRQRAVRAGVHGTSGATNGRWRRSRLSTRPPPILVKGCHTVSGAVRQRIAGESPAHGPSVEARWGWWGVGLARGVCRTGGRLAHGRRAIGPAGDWRTGDGRLAHGRAIARTARPTGRRRPGARLLA